MIFENGDRIVFAGDSVTDMGSAARGEGLFDALGHSYVRVVENLLVACYPERRIRVTNCGTSGNTSADLLQRYKADVVDLKPEWVAICIGINDVWRQFDCPAIPELAVLPGQYEVNLETMIKLVTPGCKGVFVLTPYYMEPNRDDPMRARMEEYCEICRRLAEKYGCELVDFQKMYDAFLTKRHSSCIAWDRVHPNQMGATLMAREFLKHCDFDYNRELEV